MSQAVRYFVKGIELRPTTDTSGLVEGNILIHATEQKFKAYVQGQLRNVVTEDQVQTLTNKSIDADTNTITNIQTTNLKAGVLDTDLTSVSASHDTIPSAKATKDYVDSRIASKDEASEIQYNNTTSGLSATNVQDAIDQVEARVDNSDAHIAASTDVHGIGAGNSVVGTGTAQTLTNKTLNADNNTVSNIRVTNLASGVLDTDLTSVSASDDTLPSAKAVKTYVDASIATKDQASEISYSNTTSGLVATNVQSAIDEVELRTDLADSHRLANSGVHGVTGSVVGTTDTQTLTNKVIVGASIQSPLRSDVKQDTKGNLTTYAVTAANGQLCYATDTKEYFAIKDGLLVDVGSGGAGVGSVDTLMQQTFEKAALTDFTQTGLELVSTPFIQGTKTARLIHQAASTYSFKQTVSVSPKYRTMNNTLSLSIRSSANSANVTITVKDETNNANLVSSTFTTGQITSAVFGTTNASSTVTVSDNAILNQIKVGASITGAGIPTGTVVIQVNIGSITISQNATATASSVALKVSSLPSTQKYGFAIPKDCVSLSYTITALPEAGLPETYVDDIQIYLTETAKTNTSITTTTFNATDWQSYTPTFQGFGTPTAVNFQYRQVGDTYEIHGRFTCGTTTAAEAQIGLPNSVTISSSKNPTTFIVGDLHGTSSTTTTWAGKMLADPSQSYLRIGYTQNSSDGLLAISAVNGVFSSGDQLSFFASVPIAGLSSSTTTSQTIPLTSSVLVTQPDSSLRIGGFGFAVGSTATKIISLLSGTIKENIGTAIQYLDDSVNGARFIAQQEGLYRFAFNFDVTSNNGVGFSKNSQNLTLGYDAIPESERLSVSYADVVNPYAEAYLKIGDIVRIHNITNSGIGGSTYSQFTASYQGSTKIINPSSDQKIEIPTHELRFEGASSRGSTDTAIVKFDTLAKIRGDAWDVVNTAANGTVITMKKAGTLSVQSKIDAASAVGFYISKNQQTLTAIPLASEAMGGNTSFGASATFSVNIGDKIRVATSGSISAGTNFLSLSLQETSVAVALQNVTPQWSQSDSSIRIGVGNGFGSTNTSVRRYSNMIDSVGSAASYTDSATLGAYITINEDGLFSVTATDSSTLDINEFYIVKNQTNASYMAGGGTQTTTNILASATSGNLAGSSSVATASNTVSLVKGDVIRVVYPLPARALSASTMATFSISKVGKTAGTVDVTPFVNVKTTDVHSILFNTVPVSGNLNSVKKNTNSGILTINTTTGVITALKKCLIVATVSSINANTTTRNTAIIKIDGVVVSSDVNDTANNNTGASATWSQELEAGQTIELAVSGNSDSATGSITATADNNSIVTSTQQVSSDTMNFVFKSTAIDPNVDPIGTFNTYRYTTSGSNAVAIGTSAPTQSTSSMNVNGVQVFARAGNTTSTDAQPAKVEIFIGKGLKSKNVDLYGGLAKTLPAPYDRYCAPGTNSMIGTIVMYNENTGILTIDAGNTVFGATTGAAVDSNTAYSNGYFVFSASKTPSLTSIPNLQQRVAYIKDIKTSGTTAASGFVAGTWTTRTLNTLDDMFGIVSSLSSNTFSLPAGKYEIYAISPSYESDRYKCRLYNTTDSVTAIVGSSEYSPATASGDSTHAFLMGTLNLTSQKSFQLQHRVVSIGDVNNSGGVQSGFGEVEVYSQIRIMKIA